MTFTLLCDSGPTLLHVECPVCAAGDGAVLVVNGRWSSIILEILADVLRHVVGALEA